MADSESTEMYLKSILELDGAEEPIAIARIAERVGVSAVSANEMVKRLVERDLVVHTPYKGVELTSSGHRRALSVVRRHRLWECFLVEHLSISWEQSHDLACQLEHATAEAVTEGLAAFLGHPALCPHGNPIPSPEGELPVTDHVPLSELEVGEGGVIARIYREETTLLEYLAERGLYPGTRVAVEEIAPYGDPLTVDAGGNMHVLGRQIAAHILLERD